MLFIKSFVTSTLVQYLYQVCSIWSQKTGVKFVLFFSLSTLRHPYTSFPKKNKHRKLEDVLEGKKSASRNRFGLSMLAPKDMVKPSRIAQADPAHGGCKKRGYSGDDLIQRFVQTLLLILRKSAKRWQQNGGNFQRNIIITSSNIHKLLSFLEILE